MSHSAPTVHSVHFYGSHSALLDRLSGVVSSGLLVGNSVLLVATPEHREGLVKALAHLEVDVHKYARDGQFSMFDAAELLDTFMVGKTLEPTLFVGRLAISSGSSDCAARQRPRLDCVWRNGRGSLGTGKQKGRNRTREALERRGERQSLPPSLCVSAMDSGHRWRRYARDHGLPPAYRKRLGLRRVTFAQRNNFLFCARPVPV